MQIDTINGKDWGFDGDKYVGVVFRTVRGVQKGEDDACVFVTDCFDMQPDLNVYIHLHDDDRDSTDINPFRQYARPIKDLLADLRNIDIFAAAFSGESIAYIDRELVRTFGFTRII